VYNTHRVVIKLSQAVSVARNSLLVSMIISGIITSKAS
jgi:hypothetical protein